MTERIWQPGDMAVIVHGDWQVNGVSQLNAIGMHCIVESTMYTEEYEPGEMVDVVDITIAIPGCERADVRCLQYVPPEEWPGAVFKSKELVTT